jgi:sugar lactone lactonase YvrE
MRLLFLSSLLLVAAAPVSDAGAVTTRTWRVTTYKDFDEGEATGVLLSSLGDASSGFGAKRVDVPEAAVFSSAVAPDGTVWLGTGDQAQLYAFDAKGARKVVKLDGVLVAALAVGPDGTVYAGTLPGGKVWRVSGGTAKELAKLEGAEHVWALALDAVRKTLYAATGPNGRVFAIDVNTGKNRVFWDSGEKHVLSLVREPEGSMLAGSADEAILYRIAPDGTARALHDFDGDEVRAIARHGNVAYVAVNEFEKKSGGAGSSNPPAKAHGTKIVLPSGPGASSSPPPGAPPGRDRKGKGAIYRVDLDGRVEQLHALGDSYFTALHADKDGNVFAAAGANGRVYQIRPDRTVLTALDLPERQILTFAFDPVGGTNRVLGTGDAGAIYTVDFAPPKDANYVSKVFDASFPARWGNVRWSSSGSLALETRSGNTSRPDKTWSGWQAPAGKVKETTEGRILSPAGRYMQFRAHFAKGAQLRDVTVFYLPQNQRARVTEITVGDDPGSKLAKAARAAGKPRSPVVKVKWKVENPDEDELVYRLWFREETEVNWKPLGGTEPLTGTSYEWNTEAIPDGNYVLKVVASDERANPKEAELDHALTSTPFLIDNRKPEVGGVTVSYPFASGAARDSFSPITELAYSVDGGDFQPFAPRDAVFDDQVEEFTVKLPAGLAAGTHSLAVRAVDAADNVGAVQSTFRVK